MFYLDIIIRESVHISYSFLETDGVGTNPNAVWKQNHLKFNHVNWLIYRSRSFFHKNKN